MIVLIKMLNFCMKPLICIDFQRFVIRLFSPKYSISYFKRNSNFCAQLNKNKNMENKNKYKEFKRLNLRFVKCDDITRSDSRVLCPVSHYIFSGTCWIKERLILFLDINGFYLQHISWWYNISQYEQTCDAFLRTVVTLLRIQDIS